MAEYPRKPISNEWSVLKTIVVTAISTWAVMLVVIYLATTFISD